MNNEIINLFKKEFIDKKREYESNREKLKELGIKIEKETDLLIKKTIAILEHLKVIKDIKIKNELVNKTNELNKLFSIRKEILTNYCNKNGHDMVNCGGHKLSSEVIYGGYSHIGKQYYSRWNSKFEILKKCVICGHEASYIQEKDCNYIPVNFYKEEIPDNIFDDKAYAYEGKTFREIEEGIENIRQQIESLNSLENTLSSIIKYIENSIYYLEQKNITINNLIDVEMLKDNYGQVLVEIGIMQELEKYKAKVDALKKTKSEYNKKRDEIYLRFDNENQYIIKARDNKYREIMQEINDSHLELTKLISKKKLIENAYFEKMWNKSKTMPDDESITCDDMTYRQIVEEIQNITIYINYLYQLINDLCEKFGHKYDFKNESWSQYKGHYWNYSRCLYCGREITRKNDNTISLEGLLPISNPLFEIDNLDRVLLSFDEYKRVKRKGDK